MTRSIDRRAFIGLVGAGVVGVVATACHSTTATPAVQLGAAIPGVFGSLDALAAVGKHAVGAPGVGSDAGAIQAKLRPAAEGRKWLQTTDPASLRTWLHQQVQDDFAQDRVIDVAGWQLSLTEARVAALVHLSR